jgi:hypothetical protein
MNEEYVEGSIEKFWIKLGVKPIITEPCEEGEEGFSWSDFVNGLGRQRAMVLTCLENRDT